MPRKTDLIQWHYGEIIDADRMNAIHNSVDEIWEVIDNGDLGDMTALTEKINANTNNIDKIMEIVDKPPTYIAPTLSLNISETYLEHNMHKAVNITTTYNRNDGGNITQFVLQCGSDVFVFDTLRNYTYTAYVGHGKAITFNARVLYDEGDIKNTALGNEYPTGRIPSGELSVSKTINSYARTYYGVISTNSPTTNDIGKFASVLNTSKVGTYTTNLTNQRLAILYPMTFGDLTSIKDANGFDYLSSYNKGIITYNGLGYICYTMKDPVTINNFVQKCN